MTLKFQSTQSSVDYPESSWVRQWISSLPAVGHIRHPITWSGGKFPTKKDPLADDPLLLVTVVFIAPYRRHDVAEDHPL